MPIKIPSTLPAKGVLEKENIFVMDEERAVRQDIRELRIAILNLMPTKQETEVQLLRLLSNSPLQIDITLLRPITHQSKNTSSEYLEMFYKTFSEINHMKYDGMIITGAPVEKMKFEEVNYWDEITTIMEWTKTHVTSTFHICWGAQAGLYYHYGIQKRDLSKKVFGIFSNAHVEEEKILQGLDDYVKMPQSRHSEVWRSDITNCDALKLLLYSEEAGVGMVTSKDAKQIFVTGHFEYDPYTLDEEYKRDMSKGLSIEVPKNYYRENNENKGVVVDWRSHAYTIFSNWLNFYVYQNTPYEWK